MRKAMAILPVAIAYFLMALPASAQDEPHNGIAKPAQPSPNRLPIQLIGTWSTNSGRTTSQQVKFENIASTGDEGVYSASLTIYGKTCLMNSMPVVIHEEAGIFKTSFKYLGRGSFCDYDQDMTFYPGKEHLYEGIYNAGGSEQRRIALD